MKKIFNLWMIALVAMLGFASCSDDHDCNDYDHSADLVGTWTCLQADFAEALIIKADGSVLSTGVEDGEYWENMKGRIAVSEGMVEMTFEDNDNTSGHFDIIPGEAFSIYTDEGERYTYRYCANDLSDEIVGMWVCTESKNNDIMIIQVFTEDDTDVSSGFSPEYGGYAVNGKKSYKVIGDLIINKIPEDALIEGENSYIVNRLIYTPGGTSLGDIMIIQSYLPLGNELVWTTESYLRVKQSLNLVGKKYSYNNVYLSNVKGLDQEVDFMGFKFNFAEMDGVRLDKMLKTILFEIEFPSANTIKYSCRHSGNKVVTVEAPMVVEGNKITVKVSEVYPDFKDVDLYCFQDADNCQLHMYMPTYAFEAFFGNMQVMMMTQLGELDATDADAVKAVYDSVANAVQTINVSFVMTKAAN